MVELHAKALVETPLVRVYDVRCRAPHAGYGAGDPSGIRQVITPRRGVFGVERRGEHFVVDPSSVFVVDADDACRVSHPGSDGDDCIVLVPSADVLEDWSGGIVEPRCGRLKPIDQLAAVLVTRAFTERKTDPAETEERALLLLALLLRAFPDRAPMNDRWGAGQRLRVRQVRALLASAPTARWDLGAVARSVNCSPFHLARQFRAIAGETIAHYVLRLRLSLAIDRLAAGEDDLDALALELGFAHHSHFSARFRTVFGMTPSHARETLAHGRLERLRTLVAMPA